MSKQPYKINYKEDENMVFMDWDGYATSQQFREGSETMLLLVEEFKASKVLADTKDMVIIAMEDQQWVINDFFPRLVEAGVHMIAIVNPHYYYGKVAIESLTLKANETSLTCKIFHNLSQAQEWLKGE